MAFPVAHSQDPQIGPGAASDSLRACQGMPLLCFSHIMCDKHTLEQQVVTRGLRMSGWFTVPKPEPNRRGHAAFTVRTLISTPSVRRIATTIAARLSMLGLPRAESIRWRLLDGVAAADARHSKP